MSDLTEAYASLALHKKADPFYYQRFNTAQRRFLRALADPKKDALTIILFLKPNRVGGSRVLMAAASAIMFGTSHPAAQGSPFGKRWPFKEKSARLLSTSETLGDTGPIQKAIKDLFPDGRYTQSRGVGKSYNSSLKCDDASGWDMDTMSFGQDALSAAGSTKSLILASEPMPHPMYVECLTRLGGDGVLILECTQLDLAGYLEEMSEDAGGRVVDGIQYGTLKLDGKPVGEIRVVRGDIEESCAEHHNGHQSHSAIEATIAGWPAAEREARRTGKPLRLSGRIYPEWNGEHELAAFPEWHQEMIDGGEVVVSSVLDPADQKPWALAYFLTFPNNDVICFAEWPSFEFDSCKVSPVHDLEDYRNIILEMEAKIGMPISKRYIDPLFGNAPGKGNARTLIQMLKSPCHGCLIAAGVGNYEKLDERSENYMAADKACAHKLHYSPSISYQGSVRDGHIQVRANLGDSSKGMRSKYYTLLDFTPNMARGMRRYAWKPKTNAESDDKPSLIFKDFPDLWRLGTLKRFNEYPSEPTPTVIIPRRKR